MGPLVAEKQSGELSVQLLPADGTGSFLVRHLYSFYRIASFRALPWHSDGRDPVYWHYSFDVQQRQYVLFLIAAPLTQIERTDLLTAGLPAELIPEIQVIRVQSADLVPEPGSPLRVGELIGSPENVINGVSPESLDLLTDIEAFRVSFGLVREIQQAVIRKRPNGVTIEHALNHWRIDIYVPWENPAAFAYEIVHPTNFDPFGGTVILLQGAANFHIQLVHSAEVIVEGFTTKGMRDEFLSIVRVETGVVGVDQVPAQGANLSQGFSLRAFNGFQEKLSPRLQDEALAVELWIGMIPIIGTAADIAHLVYKAGTGKNIWGETVTHEQLMVHGMFALAGAVFDADDAIKLLRGVSGRIFPGAQILDLEPGTVFRADLSTEIAESGNAYLLDAMRKLPADEQRRVAGALDDYTVGRQSADQVASTFYDVVYKAYDKTVVLELIPDRTLTEALRWIHPTQLDAFGAISLTRQDQILDAYRSVVVAGEPPQLVIDLFGPAATKEFSSLLDEWRASAVLNVFNDGFRSPLLSDGFARYVSREGSKNAVQWAAKQLTGRYAQELTLRIGVDFRAVIKRAAPRLYLEVTPAARQHFEGLANRPIEYEALREANSGFGSLFEVDHILEQRFFHNPAFADYFSRHVNQFWSLLAPKNPIVAKQLAPHFYYVHQNKTQLLRRLIPNGREAAFTLQEIYDAYVLVMIYQLKVPPNIFGVLVIDTFVELRKLSGEHVDLTIQSESFIYARNSFFKRP